MCVALVAALVCVYVCVHHGIVECVLGNAKAWIFEFPFASLEYDDVQLTVSV